MVKEKYYANLLSANNKNKVRAKFISKLRGTFGSFFVYLKFGVRCRGPPFINLIVKKFKLIGGIEWAIVPKEENIRTTLIY